MQIRKVVVAVAGVVILSSTMLVGTAGASVKRYTYTGASSLDSSTCGGNWANDTYTRTYTVTRQISVDGSYRVVEGYKGLFTTIAGPSPESCEVGSSNTITGGLVGRFKGTSTLKVSGGTYSSGETVSCTDTQTAPADGGVHGCGTKDFIKAAFGASATYSYQDYSFEYTIKKSQGCAYDWVDAATGDGGDIATSCVA